MLHWPQPRSLRTANRLKITFRQIDAFKTVVQTGTVTETARMLGISQPAVSRLISDLEERSRLQTVRAFGAQSEGDPGSPVAGRRSAPRAERSGTDQADRVGDQALQARAAAPDFDAGLFDLIAPQLIHNFAERQPEAMVSLEIQSTDVAVEWMVSQNFDFGIGPTNIVNPAVESHPLTKTRSICVLPKGHPLERKEQVSRCRIWKMRALFPTCPTRSFVSRSTSLFDKAGINRRLQYEARTTDAICRLVAEGLGVSIIVTMGRLAGAGEDFSTAPFEIDIPFNGALIWSRQKTMSAVARDFLEMVQSDFSSISTPA